MMGMRMPETCGAVFIRQVINLRSCCIWLVDSVESTMMHGLANPKKYERKSSIYRVVGDTFTLQISFKAA
jgi:hypothetical protein